MKFLGVIQTKTEEIQEMLLAIMPQWHYWFAKPFKRLLDEGVSLEMYYCIQFIRMNGEKMMTMSELAAATGMTKQQMTRVVNRLIEHNFVVRVPDSDDRRIIRLAITDNALNYINHFLGKDAAYFREFFGGLSPSDRNELAQALKSLLEIFGKLPQNDAAKSIAERKCGKCHLERQREDRIGSGKEDDR